MPGTDFTLRAVQPHSQAAPAAAPKAKSDDSGFGFDDLLDIINPLQHIPVVSTIYRHLTGDKIETVPKLAGDTLYGGLTGFLCSLGDTLFTELTGKSVGDTVYAALIGEDEPPAIAVANDNAEPALQAAAGNPVVAQQAIAAYRNTGRLLEAY